MSTRDVPDTAVETIQREMTAFARRARASAGRMHPELSLVSYTLLGHLEESGGCRATDLAAHYALDKSTVSRQVAVLERDGLIGRSVDPDDQRGQLLHLTDAGRRLLGQVTERRREVVRERLTDWPQTDLERFAAYLVRYNAAPGPTADRSAG
ncbi:MarR family winged helix-turn-helix transcriptional regulator [Streptomyces sp. NPDC003832]